MSRVFFCNIVVLYYFYVKRTMCQCYILVLLDINGYNSLDKDILIRNRTNGTTSIARIFIRVCSIRII